MFHTKVLGVPSRNLDTYFTGRDLTCALFGTHAQNADLAVMEGVMGFYDGVAGVTCVASSWELADVTDTPVILVINMRGMSLSVAALIRGFQQMKPESHIRGVILNQTSEFMCRQLRPVIEDLCQIPVLGYVPKVTDCVIESRHLGLVTPDELTWICRSGLRNWQRFWSRHWIWMPFSGWQKMHRRFPGSRCNSFYRRPILRSLL